MRIVLVGTSGTVGRAVNQALVGLGHDVVGADFEADGIFVDVTDSASIGSMYEQVGEVDAVVCTVGMLAFAPIEELTKQVVEEAIRGKLTSQVDLVLQGQRYVRPRGSFTITTGIMSRIPWLTGVGASVANGGLDGFILGAAAELAGDRRINGVSPSIVAETVEHYGYNMLPGHEPVPVARVANAFVRSISGIETGKVFIVD
jgi:NAD(P)-dependent dehydrogenase (short-subunit alcohol dehydrogenase family)